MRTCECDWGIVGLLIIAIGEVRARAVVYSAPLCSVLCARVCTICIYIILFVISGSFENVHVGFLQIVRIRLVCDMSYAILYLY